MNPTNEINKIIVRQLQQHKLQYEIDLDPNQNNGEVVYCHDKNLSWKGIFEECSDEELILLFTALIETQPLDWDMAFKIAKLLPKKGYLLKNTLDGCIANFFCNYNQLLLAYLGSDQKYESEIIKLLDEVPEDARDGLFLACEALNTPAICRKLMEKFTQWIKADPDYGIGSGEGVFLKDFLFRWKGIAPQKLNREILDFNSFVLINWRAGDKFTFLLRKIQGLFHKHIVCPWSRIRAKVISKNYTVKVVSEEEFEKLNMQFAEEAENSPFTEEELQQEFDFCETALQREFSKLPGKWEMSDDYVSNFFHCGGIYSNNMLSPRYVNAMIRAIEKTAHPDKWYYHTACEVAMEEKFPLLTCGQFLYHDRVLYVPDDGNNYTDFF